MDRVVVAEWLRRWTRNPLGSSRAGSNPAYNGLFMLEMLIVQIMGETPEEDTCSPESLMLDQLYMSELSSGGFSILAVVNSDSI